MTSELRPAVEVWRDASNALLPPIRGEWASILRMQEKAAAVIEADRKAVRAEQAAELAKWKALAETLAGALEDHLPSIVKRSTLLPGEKGDAVQLEVNLYKIADRAAALAEALRQYKEARDA